MKAILYYIRDAWGKEFFYECFEEGCRITGHDHPETELIIAIAIGKILAKQKEVIG